MAGAAGNTWPHYCLPAADLSLSPFHGALNGKRLFSCCFIKHRALLFICCLTKRLTQYLQRPFPQLPTKLEKVSQWRTAVNQLSQRKGVESTSTPRMPGLVQMAWVCVDCTVIASIKTTISVSWLYVWVNVEPAYFKKPFNPKNIKSIKSINREESLVAKPSHHFRGC